MLTYLKKILKSLNVVPQKPSLRQQILNYLKKNLNDDVSISEEERKVLKNVLDLQTIRVEDIMLPRADLQAIECNLNYHQLKEKFSEYKSSRLIVYDKDLDNILGFIHINDVLAIKNYDQFSIHHLIRKPLLIVGSLPVHDLLISMRHTQSAFAIVIDEFGGVNGLVTTWDIVGCVLGDIDQEHELESSVSHIQELSDSRYEIDARLSLTEFEKFFKISLKQNKSYQDIDTVGGLITYLAGRLPSRSELITFENAIEFKIISVNPRRLLKVQAYDRRPIDQRPTSSLAP